LADLTDVGEVVKNGSPRGDVVIRLQELLSSEDLLKDLAAATCDPRMTCERWLAVLRIELLMLFKWAVARYVGADEGRSFAGIVDAAQHALILLPRYGFALHALRRAAPFAALGMQSVISIPKQHLATARSAISPVLEALGIADVCHVSDQDPVLLVDQYAVSESAIFLTGRQSSCEAIRSRHPGASIFGATGTCGVVVAVDELTTLPLETSLSANRLSTSCSNYELSLICDGYLGSARVLNIRGTRRMADRGSLADCVRLAHPSVIFCLQDEAATSLPPNISGYAVIPCDSSGEPSSRWGFARDPLCGWPGDYCI
jgi:hypothetical protein